MDLLKFATVGSVDDGKSTLIGRLLYDTKTLLTDQIEAVKRASAKSSDGEMNFALFTDGLKDERAQGITIDVAYRYFQSPHRKFIIADCPGHVEYTRNMVTGTSHVNMVVLLVDARNGIQEQTKRHSIISSLMGVKHLCLCVNKMDLVDYQEDVFTQICKEFSEFSRRLEIPDITYIPTSAVKGENIVDRSPNMEWYRGGTLLQKLETVHIASDNNLIDSRFCVQTSIRPHNADFHDFRGYAGRVEGGVFRKNDSIVVLPSGFESKIKNIYLGDKEIPEAHFGMCATIELQDDIDVSRGMTIAKPNNRPQLAQEIDLLACNLSRNAISPKKKYHIFHTTNETLGMVTEIQYRLNVNTLRKDEDFEKLELNDIARIRIRTASPLNVDNYKKNKIMGSLIIADAATHETVAAGMVLN